MVSADVKHHVYLLTLHIQPYRYSRVTAPSDLRPFLELVQTAVYRYIQTFTSHTQTYAQRHLCIILILLLFFRIVFFVLIVLYSYVSW